MRRSGVSVADAEAHPFRSPYRCQDCEARFWVVSRRTRFGAVAGGTVALALVFFLVLPMILRHQAFDASPATGVSSADNPSAGGLGRRSLDNLLNAQSVAIDRQLQSQSTAAR
ncbi:MAG: hypothetical protein ABJB78_00555 [Betaproteobacteria bacterium]